MNSPQAYTSDGRARARGLGIALPGEPGPLNAITDVPGLEVGVTTLVSGQAVRTGVTAILPRGRAGLGQPCAAGCYSLNGNGEMTGTTWIEESGSFNLPVLLSNTHAVGACHTGVISWVNRVDPALGGQWLLPVCAETWDGYLNDINGAARGPVAEGSVGGGTGMNCYEFKGGNGTERDVNGPPPGAGSVIAIIATDAPLLPGQCKALARRVPLHRRRPQRRGSGAERTGGQRRHGRP